MKKLLFILFAASLMVSCATSGGYDIQNCIVEDCDITAVHCHMY